MTSRLHLLHEAGQAAWLDFVDRKFLASGGLKHLVDDGLMGVTSNPSIFEKAMGSGETYDEGFATFLAASDASVTATYEAQAIADIQAAADDLRPVYERLASSDGYVSLEVSPYLANDTDATIAEALRLWRAVDRPNLMVKVPGTAAGIPAVRTLIEAGLNINVTLLFAQSAYAAVAEAYLAGLEARASKSEPIDRIASVASFFVSRIDAKIDSAIDRRVAAGDPDSDTLKAVRGKVAIANAKLAYSHFQSLVESARWRTLAALGAMPQRLLWASTGTKDPSYPDTLYVDNLIGANTVNTMPPATMDAFRDHGVVAPTLGDKLDEAAAVLADVERVGLDLSGVTTQLVEAGVQQFADAFDQLLGAVAAKRITILADRLNSMTASLPPELEASVTARLEEARADDWARRLWRADPSLWTGQDEAKWLGWLAAAKGEQVDLAALASLTEKARDFPDAVLLGMGGSSLGPEVLSQLLGSRPGSPKLHVLDTTDPGQIATVVAAIDPKNTLFIVSSKSGSTMEPELLRSFFFDLAGRDGSRFVAVTDPGSKLSTTATTDNFAATFHGDPAIGGRYSVLSAFGMVPAAAMGVAPAAFYAATAPMVRACGADVPPGINPGVRLGIVMGEAVLARRDKLTIVPSKGLAPFGAWLEQLLAESTGKIGKGIVPIDLEPLRVPTAYGNDRLFVHLHLAGDQDVGLEAKLRALSGAGHPVVSIQIRDVELVGQEFFRWEIATAIAGATIGINPFDQPDVEDAKVATRKLVDAYEAIGSLTAVSPLFENQEIAIYGPPGSGDSPGQPVPLLKAFFDTLRPGDYLGFLAYLERNDEHAAAISRMRSSILNEKAVATVAGFGPRFLHSTGQAYKGGPATGAFIEITREPDPDITIPGRRASFGTVQLAQARGDLDVLAQRGQRVLRLHLKTGDVALVEYLVTAALVA
jgi:transaldolase/glucose-6-phosphate isomerase